MGKRKLTYCHSHSNKWSRRSVVQKNRPTNVRFSLMEGDPQTSFTTILNPKASSPTPSAIDIDEVPESFAVTAPDISSLTPSVIDIDEVPKSFAVTTSDISFLSGMDDAEGQLTITFVNDVLDPKPSSSSVVSQMNLCNAMLDPTVDDDKIEKGIKINGNRIVNLQYVLNWSLDLQVEHLKICRGRFILIEENRKNMGLLSKLVFKCPQCLEIKTFTTDNEEKSSINYGYVWGTDAAGSSFSPSQEILSCMDIPTMNFKFYKSIEMNLFESWEASALMSMNRAASIEKERAIKMGHIDKDGIPFITVHADGSWSKRSYGHSYNASSGVAIIIGAHTQKVLFMGVRNKSCRKCKQNMVGEPKAHFCVRNWNGSSTSMETDIIIEGFSKSVEMHGLKYKYLIGDGDASVYNTIRNSGKVAYGHLVMKIECGNHAVKNVGKKLLAAKNNTKSKIISNALTLTNIKHLEKFCLARMTQFEGQNASDLAAAFQNGPRHVYGDHRNCKSTYCESLGITNEKVNELEINGFFLITSAALQNLIRNSTKLIHNKNNNIAESFMNVMARFNMGKRLCLTESWSYQMRAALAVMRFNEGPHWHMEPYEETMGVLPGEHYMNFMTMKSRCKNNEKNRNTSKHTNSSYVHKPRGNVMPMPNIDYGPNASKAPLTKEEEEFEKKRILDDLDVCSRNFEEVIEEDVEKRINEIAQKTVGQFENELYKTYRQNRLTASNFGTVVKRLSHTSYKGLVKKILYSNFKGNEYTMYGNFMEDEVRRQFEAETGIGVQKTGLHICKNHNYLAASPDGLVGTQGIVEIKCLKSLVDKKITIEEAINDNILKNRICLTYKDGQIALKLNHDYYYQIQGQLNILEREFCYFVVFYGRDNPLFIQKINRDEELWNSKMFPILEKFFMEGILRELVQRDLQNGRDWIDPDSILEAQKNKLLRKRKNNN